MRLELLESVRSWRKSTAVTGHEFQILGLAAMGYTDGRISAELGVSRPEVASIWRRIAFKFGTSNRDEALMKYIGKLRQGNAKSLDLPAELTPGKDSGAAGSEDRELAQTRLLLAISDASVSYINGRQNVRQVYSRMLDDLMCITQSQYGLIAEVHYESGIPVLGEYAITCSDWDASAQARHEGSQKHRMLFQNLDPLFSEAVRRHELVVSNSGQNKDSEFQTPEGHPVVNEFMGIPVFSGTEIVAVIGLANCPRGYGRETANFLKPMVSTCANITVAWRLEASRRSLQCDMEAVTCLMRTMVNRASSAVLYESAERKLQFVNERFASLFRMEATPSQVVGIDTSLVVRHSKKLFADTEKFLNRVENLVDGQESCYGEQIQMADGRRFLRDFVVVRSSCGVCGYFWHYREDCVCASDSD